MYSLIKVVANILPVLLLIILGFILNRKNFLNKNTISGIKKLIVNVTLPALLFTSFIDIKFQSEYFIVIITVFVVCILMLCIGYVFSKLLKIQNPYFPLMFGGFETGMLGFPLFASVFGVDKLYSIGIVDIGQEIFVFLILVGILQRYQNQSKSFIKSLTDFLKSPVILGIAAGIVLSNTGIVDFIRQNYLGQSLLETINIISQPTIPLICIVIGYEMNLRIDNIVLPIKTILIRTAFLIIFGLIISRFIFDKVLNLDYIFNTALMTMFILPPPFVIPLFVTDQNKHNNYYILNMLSLNTLFTLILFVFYMIIWGK